MRCFPYSITTWQQKSIDQDNDVAMFIRGHKQQLPFFRRCPNHAEPAAAMLLCDMRLVRRPQIGDHGQWFSAFRNLGFGFQCVLDVSELQLLIPLSIQNFDVVFEANFKLVLCSWYSWPDGMIVAIYNKMYCIHNHVGPYNHKTHLYVHASKLHDK